MKIENIIEDIRKDIMELGNRLAEGLKTGYPHLTISVSLPGLEQLTTIKTIAITFSEGDATYYLSVDVHTHNGNRVFENIPQVIVDGRLVPFPGRHGHQDGFVELLRYIIKKNKNKNRQGDKPGHLYNNVQELANSA